MLCGAAITADGDLTTIMPISEPRWSEVVAAQDARGIDALRFIVIFEKHG